MLQEKSLIMNKFLVLVLEPIIMQDILGRQLLWKMFVRLGLKDLTKEVIEYRID